MHLEIEEHVIDIAEHVSKSLGDALDASTTRWISRPFGREQVKDATLAFYVDCKKHTDDAVLLISNFSFSTVVPSDVARAREVAVRARIRTLGHVDKRDSHRPLIVIQAGICNGDQLGTRPHVGRGVDIL